MADVKDILGVPRGSASSQQDAPKTKERVQRPAGMSREAFALLDGSHPIPPTHLTGDLNKKAALAGLKQKRKLSSKGLSTYQFRPFTNPARKDGLVLQHWVKCFKDTAGKLREADETYPFAKFNKQVPRIQTCYCVVPPLAEALAFACSFTFSSTMMTNGIMCSSKILHGQEERQTICLSCASFLIYAF